MPSHTRFLPMLRMYVSHQRLELHLLPALNALNPTPLPLPVGSLCCCHPSPIRCLLLRPRRLARAADHYDCLPYISLQVHPIKNPYQGSESSLDSSRVRLCHHAIICIEEAILMSDLLSGTTPLFRTLHHYCDPILRHRIHHHVEDGGG